MSGGAKRGPVAADPAASEWRSRQAAFDAAVARVEEFEEWKSPKAPALRALVDGIGKQVDAGAHAKAVAVLDQLLPKIQPIHDQLEKQKDAQRRYRRVLASLEPRLPGKAKARSATLAKMQSEIAGLRGEMERFAKSRDFVSALQVANDLGPSLAAYSAAVRDIDGPKAAYELSSAALRLPLAEAAKGRGWRLASPQDEIRAGHAPMEEAAQAGDFERALQLADDLWRKLDAYGAVLDEVEGQRAAYERTLAPIRSKLDEASQGAARFKSVADDLRAGRAPMEEAAEGWDFERALQLATDLAAKIASCEAAGAGSDGSGAASGEALAALRDRIEAATKPSSSRLVSQQDDIRALVGPIAEAERGGDSSRVTQLVGDLTSRLERYEATLAETERLKAEYEAAVAPLLPRLDQVAETEGKGLKPIKAQIRRARAEMEASARVDDFGAALRLVADVTAKIDEFDATRPELERQQEEIDALVEALEPRLDEALQSSEDSLSAQQDVLRTLQTEMKGAASSCDLELATALSKRITAKLDVFAAALAELTPPAEEETPEPAAEEPAEEPTESEEPAAEESSGSDEPAASETSDDVFATAAAAGDWTAAAKELETKDPDEIKRRFLELTPSDRKELLAAATADPDLGPYCAVVLFTEEEAAPADAGDSAAAPEETAASEEPTSEEPAAEPCDEEESAEEATGKPAKKGPKKSAKKTAKKPSKGRSKKS